MDKVSEIETSSRESSEKSSTSSIRLLVETVNRSSRCRCSLWTLAFICAATVVFMLAAYDDVVEAVATNQLVLEEGGSKFEAWKSTPMPIEYKMFIFNLTNPQEFMEGDRPRVRECGPYVYKMREDKMDIKFHPNGTVSYRTKPMYIFDPERSLGSHEDIIWSVNIPFVNAADAVKDKGFLRVVIEIAKRIHGFEPLRRLTVQELLWGYKSRVIDWARTLQELPYPHPHFGLLVGFNNTPQEPYLMYTGKGDPMTMNRIYSWNGKTKLDFWSGDRCNVIHGTDAGGFHPNVQKNETLYIFNGQLCRSIPLEYQGVVQHNGIQAYRFSPPADLFSYGPKMPKNNCFCGKDGCPPSGVLDMKPCYWGAAVAFSLPHFYQADAKLRHVVRGLRPDPELHATHFDVYPALGIPVRVKLRMQMNVVLDRNVALDRARHFDVIFPIFWFEVGIDSLPEDFVSMLQLAQNLPPVVKATSLTVCIVLTVIFLGLLLSHTLVGWCNISLTDTRAPTPDHLPQQAPPHVGQWQMTTKPDLENGTVGEGTMLPPYRRRRYYEDSPSDDVLDSPFSTLSPPPAYSSDPPSRRSPSVISVEIHTMTSSDYDAYSEKPGSPCLESPGDLKPGPESSGELCYGSLKTVPSNTLSPPDVAVAPLASGEDTDTDMEKDPPHRPPRSPKSCRSGGTSASPVSFSTQDSLNTSSNNMSFPSSPALDGVRLFAAESTLGQRPPPLESDL